MATIVQAEIVEIDTVDPQTSLEQQLALLAIPSEDFLGATSIAMEENNQKAKIVILYAKEE